MQTIQKLQEERLKKDLPVIRPGDQVRVSLKIIEGAKERVQNYEGVVVRFNGHGISRSVVVRRVVSQIGVEKSFPLHSPRVTKIKILKQGKVRRAKLYYLRQRVGRKATRIHEKRETLAPGSAAPVAVTTSPEQAQEQVASPSQD
jgi:large subunit ribosomal protein L19